jgi:hypothetical protein
MTTGIDVEPTTHHFWADGWDKAVEYGDWPKVVLALRSDALRHTGRRAPADIDADELRELQRERLTTVRSDDGRWLLLSRLPADHRALASDDEAHYGRWIDGDASAALRCVFLITHPSVGVAIDRQLLERWR